jgi:hypothetical protein
VRQKQDNLVDGWQEYMIRDAAKKGIGNTDGNVIGLTG